jgi:hypothetical protein
MIGHYSKKLKVGDIIIGIWDDDLNWYPEARGIILRESSLDEYIEYGRSKWPDYNLLQDMLRKGLNPEKLFYYEFSMD